MTDITTLSIPKDIIARAKILGINCSKVARDAIEAAIRVIEFPRTPPV